MKEASELETANKRPRLVIKRQRESLEKAKQKCRAQADEMIAMRGKVRDLEVSRNCWKQRHDEASELAAKAMEENARLQRELLELKKKEHGQPVGATIVERAPRSGYSMTQVGVIIEHLVLGARLSFEAISRVVNVLIDALGLDWLPVSASTVRWWVIRLGIYRFQAPLVPADDWILLIDHSVQIGPEKCLVVLGIRASALPAPGVPLQVSDLHPVALFATEKTSKELVHQQLEAVAEEMGSPPLSITSDQGAELVNGLKSFCEDRQTTASVDIAHKCANLLKKELTSDRDWGEYNKTVANIAAKTRLTSASFLTPPPQRSKARFMNLGKQFSWAQKTLTLLDNPSLVSEHLTAELLEEKLGPLRSHRASIEKWNHLHRVCDTVISVVGRHGYGESTVAMTRAAIEDLITPDSEAFAQSALEFVRAQCEQAPTGRRIVASTEVLESAFGRYKATAGDHVKGGFTSLLPALGTLVGTIDTDEIREGLLKTPLKKAKEFLQNLLGTTHNAKRRQAYQAATGAAQEQLGSAQ